MVAINPYLGMVSSLDADELDLIANQAWHQLVVVAEEQLRGLPRRDAPRVPRGRNREWPIVKRRRLG